MFANSRLRVTALAALGLGLLGFGVAPPAGAQNPNLIPNPEFHQNVDDWSSSLGYTTLEWDGFDWTECGALSGSALFTHYGPAASQTGSGVHATSTDPSGVLAGRPFRSSSMFPDSRTMTFTEPSADLR